MLAPARCAAGASTRCAAGVLRKSPHGRQSRHAAAGRAQVGSRRGAQVVGIVAVAANIHGAALLIGIALGS
jgi:hypothetical protein